MPVRLNDPKTLEKWIVDTDQRLRTLEARRLDAADGLTKDEATKQMAVKVSEDAGNGASIGEDGGVFAQDTVTTADDHTPLWIQLYMTSGTGQSIPNAADTLIVWQATYTSGTWTSTASTITIPEDGFYGVALDFPWQQNTTGTNRVVHVTLNSTAVATGSTMVAQTYPAAGEVSSVMTDFRVFAAGDVLRCYAFQNSTVPAAGALNGGSVYFGDVRGRWTVWKMGDSYPPSLTQSTE